MSDTHTKQPNITGNDIRSCIAVIEMLTSRGAVKPNEMKAIGDLYERLSAILEYAQKTSDAPQATTPNSATEE